MKTTLNNPFAEVIDTFNNKEKAYKRMWEQFPAAAFMGIELNEMSLEHGIASVPYRWNSTNPFGSTYFIGLCGAGELASGAVAAAMKEGYAEANISMLVSNVEAKFYQKATDTTTFAFTEGTKMRAAIEQAIETGQAQTFVATAIGKNEKGKLVSVIKVTWWFKQEEK
jgi:hypothetical protein